jgi:hypothetical protein
MQQPCVQIRLGKAGNGRWRISAWPRASKVAGMLVLAGIFGIGSQPGVQIMRVIGIQLLLDHLLRGQMQGLCHVGYSLVQISAKKRQPSCRFHYHRGQPAYFSTWVTSRTAPVSALVVMAA